MVMERHESCMEQYALENLSNQFFNLSGVYGNSGLSPEGWTIFRFIMFGNAFMIILPLTPKHLGVLSLY